jgi:hypothetical protein
MIEVFPIDGILKDFDARMNQAAFTILVLLFLVSLGIYALNRFENFALDSKVYAFIVLSTASRAWWMR